MNKEIKIATTTALIVSTVLLGGGALLDRGVVTDSEFIEFCDSYDYCYEFTGQEFKDIKQILLDEEAKGTISPDNLATLEAMKEVEKNKIIQ